MKKWASIPFERFENYIREYGQLLYICKYSVSNVNKLVVAEEIVQELGNILETSDDAESQARTLAHYREHAAFAQAEIDKGFPLLHAHAIVGLWGALEATIIDFMVAWLTNEPNAIQSDAFSKVKIPLSEFETLEKEERVRLLIDEVERSQRSQNKAGLSRFEALLATINLSSEIPDETQKTLYELFNIRNVVVHRASIVDRRLLAACPWLPYTNGEVIKISESDVERYTKAATQYCILVINRVKTYTESTKDIKDKRIETD